MKEIPLFPLNTVLFPRAPLHLHIFEERYKRMVQDCIDEKQEFGVVLIQSGREALGPLAEPHPIGCSTKIVDTRFLSGGQMNIVTIGQERFRILSTDRDSQPYLMGTVEPYPLLNLNPDYTQFLASKLRKHMENFVAILLKAGGGEFDFEQLPEEPVRLAYAAAAILQITPVQKQELLGMETAEDLLSALLPIYRREKSILNMMVAHGKGEAEEVFSRN